MGLVRHGPEGRISRKGIVAVDEEGDHDTAAGHCQGLCIPGVGRQIVGHAGNHLGRPVGIRQGDNLGGNRRIVPRLQQKPFALDFIENLPADAGYGVILTFGDLRTGACGGYVAQLVNRQTLIEAADPFSQAFPVRFDGSDIRAVRTVIPMPQRFPFFRKTRDRAGNIPVKSFHHPGGKISFQRQGGCSRQYLRWTPFFGQPGSRIKVDSLWLICCPVLLVLGVP